MTRQFDQQFFVREDVPVEGPPRELVGYGEHPPKVRWKNDARVAVQIVVNVRGGLREDVRDGRRRQRQLPRVPVRARGAARPRGRVVVRVRLARRHLAAVPRLRRGGRSPSRSSPPPSRSSATPRWRRSSPRRGDEAAGHGYRWSNHFEMTRDEEREAIRGRSSSIERTTGARPVGWYCREMSVNTRELVVEEGGFLYDSDCYNDDLPYWTRVLGRPHLVVPYGLVVNDARYVTGNGFGEPRALLRDGEGASRPPAQRRRRRVAHDVDRAAPADHRQPRPRRRARALHRLRPVGSATSGSRGAVDIARTFVEQQPAEHWLGEG